MKDRSKNVYIKGNHPIRDYVLNQYICKGFQIYECLDDASNFLEDGEDTILILLTSPSHSDRLKEDQDAIQYLKFVAEKMTMTDSRRPQVHVLFQSSVTLELLLKYDLPSFVNEKLDVYPFTMEDMWAKNVWVSLPGITKMLYPSLDRLSITSDSSSKIHLVISGFDEQAEILSIHAALLAHFPNYRSTDRYPIRTRITLLDQQMKAKRDAFIARYSSLFMHSYYRTVSVQNQVVHLHKPVSDENRKAFVDVEWEFVEGSITDDIVRDKIERWSIDQNQQLTLVISHDDDEVNLKEVLCLPTILKERNIPVLVRLRRSELADLLKESPLCSHLYPFGMYDRGYDVELPLIRMAKYLNYFYRSSYQNKEIPTDFSTEEVENAWKDECSLKMRFSNIYNVMTIPCKMHSLGHEPTDTIAFYALNQSEIESLAETEHNRWCVERLILGDRPCTDDEKKIIRQNIQEIIDARSHGKDEPENLKVLYKKQYGVHYDLCAFDELEMDATGKNVQVYDYDLTASIPLIYKTYLEDVGYEG